MSVKGVCFGIFFLCVVIGAGLLIANIWIENINEIASRSFWTLGVIAAATMVSGLCYGMLFDTKKGKE